MVLLQKALLVARIDETSHNTLSRIYTQKRNKTTLAAADSELARWHVV